MMQVSVFAASATKQHRAISCFSQFMTWSLKTAPPGKDGQQKARHMACQEGRSQRRLSGVVPLLLWSAGVDTWPVGP